MTMRRALFGLRVLETFDKCERDVLPVRYVGHIGAEQCVEAEKDRFAVKQCCAIGNREFAVI